jgi:hypothetical protein
MRKFGNDYMDGKRLFEVYWVEMGSARSIAKLQKWCITNDMVHPISGKPPTRMGIWKCMYRWAINNQKDAYDMAQDGASQYGDFITPEDWATNMANKVTASWQNPDFARKYAKKWDLELESFATKKRRNLEEENA